MKERIPFIATACIKKHLCTYNLLTITTIYWLLLTYKVVYQLEKVPPSGGKVHTAPAKSRQIRKRLLF